MDDIAAVGTPSVVVGVSRRGSLRTLAWAADLAHATGARVIAVHAITCHPIAMDPIEGWVDLVDDGAAARSDLIERCREVLDPRGVTWDAEVIAAPTTAALLLVARRVGPAALVVGRPTSAWRLLRLRSVLRTAPCAVVLVAAPDAVPAAWDSSLVRLHSH